MIRGIGYWHFINAQWDDGWPICPGKPDYYPHVLHPSRIYFIPRYGAERGNQGNQPNKRATETMPNVLLRSNFTSADVYFNDCLQQLSNGLASRIISGGQVMAEQLTVTPTRSGGAIASVPDCFRFRRGQ